MHGQVLRAPPMRADARRRNAGGKRMRVERLYGALLVVLGCSEGEASRTQAAGDSGTDGGAPSTVALPSLVSHCGGELELFELPSNPGERGPWAVGARAVSAAGLQARSE